MGFVVFSWRMKKIVAVAVLSCALVSVPAVASAAPVAPAPVAESGSSQGGTGSSQGGTGSSETALICSPVAQLLFATGSVEKPPLYDLLCLFS
ncbi:hypothetical protein [Nocardia rhizosphaerihabitans]|uniref:Secreted protein n=1 Tax=Nocardia rhizosphaerihabitans TaxID=1691570 RepID=A0ABQ2KL62_9NOCA|nr:hypothetical protein [Nocardia rhizosphaerihabitans]GGN85672.1 hypothetical protein GCM10011610_40300 [Nocardia rhizosphaerihabitans]